MENGNKLNKIQIVCFSGTGGALRAAKAFEAELIKHGAEVTFQRLTGNFNVKNSAYDLLIMVYAVYAFSASEPVYKWIEKAKPVNGTPAAVISVSGGGEVTPNTACRKKCIRRLEKKGYTVSYENMIVMPSNVVVPTKEPLALMLLEALPFRVAGMANDIRQGKRRRTKPAIIDNAFSFLGGLEKFGAGQLGKRMKITGGCNGCGWCAKNCNAGNITMVDNKPRFGSECLLCMNCLYGCPRKAIVPGYGKFIVIKEGFDLNILEKKLPYTENADINELAKGYLWSGVRKYLLETE